MSNIRKADLDDIFRIAEIIVTNYRINFYPFFKNDEFYFGELNVIDTAREISENIENTFVYDNGVIRGVICTEGKESPDEKCGNNDIRLHRRDFYLRNGFFETGLYNRYKGVEFIVACSENDFRTEEYMEFVSYLRSIVPDYRPEIYKK